MLTAPSNALAVGNTLQLSATAKDSSGNAVSGAVFTYFSDNTAAATVSATGLVTAVAAGAAKMTAAAGGVTSAALTITVTATAVAPTPLVVSTSNLAGASVGSAYSQTLVATGSGTFQWSALTIAPGTGSSNGLNNLSIGAATGTISGTPKYAGIQPIVATVTRSDGAAVSIQTELYIGGTATQWVINNSPAAATQGSSYSFTFDTNWIWHGGTAFLGCTTSLRWVAGSVPPGLSFNGLAGTLKGTPLIAGHYPITLYGSNVQSGCATDASVMYTYDVLVAPASSPATHPGGSNFSRTGTTPELSPSVSGWDGLFIGSPSVVKVGGTYSMFYEGLSNSSYLYSIGLATSTNAVSWTRVSTNPVLSAGASGSWDSHGVRYPSVVYDGAQYRMWYQGSGPGGTAIGYATSPDGKTWTENAANPVITKSGVISAYAPGSIVQNGSQFVMYYSADGYVGQAVSADGVAWTDNGPATFPSNTSGYVIEFARPAVVLDGSTYRMWYGRIEDNGAGGAVTGAGPYNFGIGYADSPDGKNWTTYGNPVLASSAAGAWDRPGVGAPAVIKDGTTFRLWYAGGRGNLPGAVTPPASNAFVEGAIGQATAQ